MSVVNISSTFSLVVDGLLMHFTYRTVYSTFSTLSERLESLKRAILTPGIQRFDDNNSL